MEIANVSRYSPAVESDALTEPAAIKISNSKGGNKDILTWFFLLLMALLPRPRRQWGSETHKKQGRPMVEKAGRVWEEEDT